VCVYSVFVLSYIYVEALRQVDHSFKESYRLNIDLKEKILGTVKILTHLSGEV
jgi:hypothetical protein